MTKDSALEFVTRKITLTGITPVMFDRYSGDNKTSLRPEEKFYFDQDGRTLVLPSQNIVSLLSAQNTPSAPKRFLDARKYRATASGILSFTVFRPILIPFMREGRRILFDAFDGGTDPKSGAYVHHSVARLDRGIPNPKDRPVLPTPWELSFEMDYYRNEEVQEEQIRNLMIRGGISIGIGTFRGVYGKFHVTKWQ